GGLLYVRERDACNCHGIVDFVVRRRRQNDRDPHVDGFDEHSTGSLHRDHIRAGLRAERRPGEAAGVAVVVDERSAEREIRCQKREVPSPFRGGGDIEACQLSFERGDNDGPVSCSGRLALYRTSPRSAGVVPSQCCSKLARNDTTSPAPPSASSRMVKRPVRVLHPRPPPDTSSPGGPAPRNANRAAPSYEPTASGSVLGAPKSRYHQ